MSDFRKYPIIMKRHTDEEGNVITIKRTDERKQITHRHIVLEDIPHPYQAIEIKTDNVWVTKFKEVPLHETIENINEYKLDYSEGKIWFHWKLEGSLVDVTYYGTGFEMIHASRVYTQNTPQGNVTETLEDIISYNSQAIKVLGELKDAINTIDRVNVLERKVAELENFIKNGGVVTNGEK